MDTAVDTSKVPLQSPPGGGTDKQDKFLSGPGIGSPGTASFKESQEAIAKAGVVDKPVTPAIPTKAVEVLSPAQGMVYSSQQDLEVRLRIDKNLFPTWNTSKWGFGFGKAGGSSLPEYATGGASQFVSEDHGQYVELATMVPHIKLGKTESWQKPGSWHFELTEIKSGSVNTVPSATSDFAFDQFDSFAATQVSGGPKFGSKVPQIAKGTGPAFSGGVPATQFPPNPCIGANCPGPSQIATGEVTSSGAGAFSEPAPASPRGFGSRMPPPPVGGGGIASRSAGPMPTDAAPGLMAPGTATTAAARTADLMADLEVVSLSMDGSCNIWATLKNGGSAAIRETVKESIALDGRNALTSSVALNLAPGQSQRRQVASYGRINFAEASVRYDVALSDANTSNNSLEQSFTCPKAATETPMRTAPAPGIAPPPSGRTLPGR